MHPSRTPAVETVRCRPVYLRMEPFRPAADTLRTVLFIPKTTVKQGAKYAFHVLQSEFLSTGFGTYQASMHRVTTDTVTAIRIT